MKPKIFFTDLDDTLLNTDKEISSGNRAALAELKKQGHYIAICTGRATGSAVGLAHRLGLDDDHCFLITYNGSHIFEWRSKKLIYTAGLPLDVVRFIFDEGKKFGINVQTYREDAVLVEEDNYDIREYIKIQSIPYLVVEDVTKAVDQLPPKVLAADYRHPERVAEFRRQITPLLEGKADIFLSHIELLEFVPPGVNKGNAVRYLCDYLSIPLENSVAAGDAENDLSMITAAHVGCAMCNGEDGVKEAADYVTVSDCDHDGVAELLHRFILDEQ
ncbi:MAG: HAD family phosphatase [Blautia sp.]|nr:HAD family phosphatase [Blautia sp.]